MINLHKSENPPKCLSEEKKKANGDYKCGEVLKRLKEDFYNKCYLCEEKEPSTINVEHLIPHKGGKELKFDWNNLFWACGHCNNTKLDKYNKILDCTDFSKIITDLLKFEINPFPFELAKISALSKKKDVVETATLLNEIYNGTTILKTIEGDNKRTKLIKELVLFNEKLHEYFEPGLSDEEKEKLKNKIRRSLSIEAPFTAFKIWVIKNNTKLAELFSDLLPDFQSN
jgi:hypothetical protein